MTVAPISITGWPTNYVLRRTASLVAEYCVQDPGFGVLRSMWSLDVWLQDDSSSGDDLVPNGDIEAGGLDSGVRRAPEILECQ